MSCTGHFTLSNLEASNIVVDTIGKTILPLHSDVNLGSLEHPFKEIFVSSDTIHIGDVVSLGVEKEGDAVYFTPSAAMKLKVGSKDIIIDPSDGFVFGDTKIKDTGLEFISSAGEPVIVDKDIFTTIDERITRIAKDIGIESSFGYMVEYTLRVEPTSNNIKHVDNGNFQLGKVFDKSDSLGLNTIIIKSFPNKLPSFSKTGDVTFFSIAEQQNVRNVRINNNAINFTLTSGITDDNYIVPIERNTNLRDIFPINIFDMNKFEGRIKFKADFDNVGSLYYSDDGTTFSGLQALKNYVQVSNESFYGQNISVSIAEYPLSSYENVVEFISYYQLPLLFENQTTFKNTRVNKYEYYSSSLASNRINNNAFINDAETTINVSESVYGFNTTISSTKLRLKTLTQSLYPAIRVIKWKNIYNPIFTRVTSTDMEITQFKTALGWTETADIYSKYTTNTNTGENWISKLVEITYAYLKYGQPLKLLGTLDMTKVTTIISNIDGSSSFLEFQNDINDVAIRIKKEAFESHLY
tara:strand:- start:13149 stop:14723 length:1575 start_codon:yes stop_codon:yes gene_type:complete